MENCKMVIFDMDALVVDDSHVAHDFVYKMMDKFLAEYPQIRIGLIAHLWRVGKGLFHKLKNDGGQGVAYPWEVGRFMALLTDLKLDLVHTVQAQAFGYADPETGEVGPPLATYEDQPEWSEGFMKPNTGMLYSCCAEAMIPVAEALFVSTPADMEMAENAGMPFMDIVSFAEMILEEGVEYAD